MSLPYDEMKTPFKSGVSGKSLVEINADLTESNRQLREQLLHLINCSASLLAHTPDFPALSDGGAAQEFLKGEIKRARELKL